MIRLLFFSLLLIITLLANFPFKNNIYDKNVILMPFSGLFIAKEKITLNNSLVEAYGFKVPFWKLINWISFPFFVGPRLY